MIPEQLICECRHDPNEHALRRQHCRGIDSYGVVCTCQSYEEMSDGDEPLPSILDADSPNLMINSAGERFYPDNPEDAAYFAEHHGAKAVH